MHPSRYVAPALLTVSCCARLRPFVAPQPAAGLQPHLLVPRGCLAASVASSACCTVVLTVTVCVCRTWCTWSVTLGQPPSHLAAALMHEPAPAARAAPRARKSSPRRRKRGILGEIPRPGAARGRGGVQRLPTGGGAGEKISECCPRRSARPRAAAPLQLGRSHSASDLCVGRSHRASR